MPTILEYLRTHAPWLLAPELGLCVVGSTALDEACRRAKVPGPNAHDLDLSWLPQPDDGERVLREHGVYVATTDHNRNRGTLALRLPALRGDGNERIEITTLRAGSPDHSIHERIRSDLGARDMTLGSIAWWLTEDRIIDPWDGLADWRAGRIIATGDPAERIAEHPVRWIRYYRRAHQWDFELDPRIRKLWPDDERRALLEQIPIEALSAELRSGLLDCRSPGRWLHELHEAGLLDAIAPELAPQFDGRPAGPIRYHPEVSQALHMILCLEWIGERTKDLPAADRLAATLAVLCHDLGKNLSPTEDLPSHRGHEQAGPPIIDRLLKRFPSLADQTTKRLATTVSELHLQVRRFDEVRPGTLAQWFERWFRAKDFRVDLFALAIGADVGGRLDCADEGDRVAAAVQRNLDWLRERCGAVDAGALRTKHPRVEEFRRALHEARATALRGKRPGA